MAHLVVVISGLADDPHEALDGRTPLAVARTPWLDRLAEPAEVGLVQPLPELPADDPGAGVDRALPALLGYEAPLAARGAVELIGADAGLGRRDSGVRLDLLRAGPPVDPFADEPAPDEARALWESLTTALSRRDLVVRGVGPLRGLGLWSEGPVDCHTTPPGELTDDLTAHRPEGDGAERLGELIDIGREVLAEHPVNRRRAERDQPIFDLVWPWGVGRAAELPLFALRSGMITVGVTDNLAARGSFRRAGIPCPPARVRRPVALIDEALRAFQQAAAVIVQTSIVDWVGHRGDPERKQRAIERLDDELLRPVYEYAADWPALDVTLLGDHATLVATRRHAARPVPYLRLRRDRPQRGPGRFDESVAADADRLREGGGWLWSGR